MTHDTNLQQTPVLVPHFSLPFRFIQQGKGYPTAAVNEQDTADEVADCVEAILRYEIGSRAEKPEFGITDPTFASPTVDTNRLHAEVDQWEQRAALGLIAGISDTDALVHMVQVRVESNKRGGAGA